MLITDGKGGVQPCVTELCITRYINAPDLLKCSLRTELVNTLIEFSNLERVGIFIFIMIEN